jgi:hypothetical protein
MLWGKGRLKINIHERMTVAHIIKPTWGDDVGVAVCIISKMIRWKK